MNLIFNEIERLNIIGLFLARGECGGGLSADYLARFADRHKADYIVFDRYWKNEMAHESMLKKGFRILKKHPDYIIIARE